jgi:ParB-like chromosome segregation protein Spo0J
MKIETLPTDSLVPYARNSRTHSPQQVQQIAGSIREFGFTNPVLIDSGNGIIAGHGRVMAAQMLGIDKVPCIRLGHLTEIQKQAYIIADNKLALNAGWDEAMLGLELAELREADFDLGLMGFDADEIEAALNPPEPGDGLSDEYTHKIDAPVYEPKGEKPPIEELTKTEKADELKAKIESSKVPDEIKRFLKQAAQRHVVFDYGKIAEFYCHADKETQELMEDSALVLIDFKKALQHGYVKLKEGILDALESEMERDEDES